jgi:hypothetical protein
MSDDDKAKPDLSEIFDLKHSRAARDYVNGFMDLYRRRDALGAEVKAAAEAARTVFSPVEVKALQDIAKWKVADKGNAAAGKIAALRRVSTAVKYDLFSWADRDRDEA